MTYPSTTPQNNFPTSVPINQPLYGASFGQAVKRFFTKYATFSGRASRSEYWWFMLFNAIVVTVLTIAAIVLGIAGADPATGEPGVAFILPMILLSVYGLAVILPGISVSVRRLHDGNYSGFMYFLSFIPAVGGLVILIFMLLPSDPAGGRFDEYPPQQYGYTPYGQAPSGYPDQPGA